MDWDCGSVNEWVGKEFVDLELLVPLASKMPFEFLSNLISINTNLKRILLNGINLTEPWDQSSSRSLPLLEELTMETSHYSALKVFGNAFFPKLKYLVVESDVGGLFGDGESE